MIHAIKQSFTESLCPLVKVTASLEEKKGTTEDEIAGWHHQLDGHEFE